MTYFPLAWTNQSSAQTSTSKTLTIISPPASVSEMERSRVALITLICVMFFNVQRFSGEEVEIRVRPRDDVSLCDCVRKYGFHMSWFTAPMSISLLSSCHL
ncbi:hypothetical protein NFI96_023794 [Prochilodus magdalenae]|nr:hypothetical protein NFI96_023794 [Prochilodus magdalenae]